MNSKLHQAEIIKLLTPYLSLFPHSKVDSLGLVIYAKSLTELSLAVGLGLKAKDVGKVIHAHPSLSEGLMEAIHDIHGECVHAIPKK